MLLYLEFVGNKANRQISKTGVTKNNHAKFFEKRTSLTCLIHTCMCVYHGIKKTLHALLSCKHRLWSLSFCLISINLTYVRITFTFESCLFLEMRKMSLNKCWKIFRKRREEPKIYTYLKFWVHMLLWTFLQVLFSFLFLFLFQHGIYILSPCFHTSTLAWVKRLPSEMHLL